MAAITRCRACKLLADTNVRVLLLQTYRRAGRKGVHKTVLQRMLILMILQVGATRICRMGSKQSIILKPQSLKRLKLDQTSRAAQPHQVSQAC